MLIAIARLACAAEAAAPIGEIAPSPPVQVESNSSAVAEAELLRKAQAANEDLYASLRSFVCDEDVWRTRENLKATKVRNLDVLTARVSFENGQEVYSDVYQDKVRRSGLEAAGGAWSVGEFGTLLRQTQQLLKTQQVTVEGSGDENGTPVAYVSFDVSREDSPWSLVVEGRSYKIPFRTRVTLEVSTGHILSVRRDATALPPRLFISEIEWSVDMRPTPMAGASWLLPAAGEYAVSYAGSNQRDRNRMAFGNYRRYGSESTLRFDAAE
jgi:hypothetical protein